MFKSFIRNITVSFAFALIVSACSTDPCENVVCQNNGIPVKSGDNCICECPGGYTGSLCEIDYCTESSGLICQNDGEPTYSENEEKCVCACPYGYVGEQCQTNLCAGLECLNGGEHAVSESEDECTCACAPGYTGATCENEIRELYIGSYSGIENCGSMGSFHRTIQVSFDTTAALHHIIIDNLFETNTTLTIHLSTNDWTSFNIPVQTTPSGKSIKGSGVFTFGEEFETASLSVFYEITTDTLNYQCSTTKIKD